jgi:prepilin-type processing-associated H-X9-DG protein
MAYEREENHEEEGINILFGDGHVEWQDMAAARQLIEQQGGAPGGQ